MAVKRIITAAVLSIFVIFIFVAYSYTHLNDCFHSNENGIAVYHENDQDINDNLPEEPEITKGYYIYINLDICQMYVYKDGELLKIYPVSGGKPSTPTPLGTWKIITKDTWGEGFGGAWMGLNVPWGKYGIHGTVEPWFVGKSNQSKGCIRMKNNDVRELYRIVPHGTIVKIVHKNRPFRTMKSGDVGSDVLEIQKALKKLGYYQGYPDGKFGNILRESVKKFQKDHGLYQTGVVNISTYNKILEKAKELETLPSPIPPTLLPSPAATVSPGQGDPGQENGSPMGEAEGLR